MKVISVNIGLPRLVEYDGEQTLTGIYKEPAAGVVKVNRLNLEGDGQADLEAHGGAAKAVYAYPEEHYEFWRKELPEMDLSPGIFGENLTTEGLSEKEVFIGDKYRIGTAEFIITQPRFPCFKLGIRFGRKDIIKRFQQSERFGIYLAIAKTGQIQSGDEIELISRDKNKISVAGLANLRFGKREDTEMMKRVLLIETLPDNWRKHLLEKIETNQVSKDF